jgi:HPt (histidine-containing phosphotransfer) domain-containing protein
MQVSLSEGSVSRLVVHYVYTAPEIDRSVSTGVFGRGTMRRLGLEKGVGVMVEDAADLKSYAALDVAHLQEISDGDRAFESELLRIFVEDCGIRLKALNGAIACGDDKAAHRESHTIKGAALNVGTLRLHSLARALEAIPPSAEPAAARVALCALEQEFENLRQEVTRYLQA